MGSKDESCEFGWCFSHGRLHHKPQWCTATWVPVEGVTSDEALASKRQLYGEAEFLHQLPAEVQHNIVVRWR